MSTFPIVEETGGRPSNHHLQIGQGSQSSTEDSRGMALQQTPQRRAVQSMEQRGWRLSETKKLTPKMDRGRPSLAAQLSALRATVSSTKKTRNPFVGSLPGASSSHAMWTYPEVGSGTLPVARSPSGIYQTGPCSSLISLSVDRTIGNSRADQPVFERSTPSTRDKTLTFPSPAWYSSPGVGFNQSRSNNAAWGGRDTAPSPRGGGGRPGGGSFGGSCDGATPAPFSAKKFMASLKRSGEAEAGGGRGGFLSLYH